MTIPVGTWVRRTAVLTLLTFWPPGPPEREKAQAQVAHLEGASVTIAQRVAEEERLYGSVTAGMIAEALESQGFIVDKKQLDLPEPIKKLGTYEVTIRLAPEVQTTVSVVVVSDKA